MVIAQDSSDPSGIRGTGNNAGAARMRKATAGIQLRLSGATWNEISESLGYPTPRAAKVAVERALERELHSSEDRTALRDLADRRLERLMRSVWSKAIDPSHPEHLLANTKARELVGQWSKLHGLDAPSEVVVHSPTTEAIEQWVAFALSQGAPALPEGNIIDVEVIEAMQEIED